MGADRRLANPVSHRPVVRGLPAVAKLDTVHARDHNEGRRYLTLGMLTEPVVPRLRERNVFTVLLATSVDDEQEEITVDRGGDRHLALGAVSARLRGSGDRVCRRLDPLSTVQ